MSEPAIREVAGEQLLETLPLRAYAFDASPKDHSAEDQRQFLAVREHDRTFVAYDGDRPVATATVIPMTQSVRGIMLPMAGINAVASDPVVRRHGLAGRLVRRVLAEARAGGQVVSCLYPFRAGYYTRFGYTLLPQPLTARIPLAGLLPILERPVPGELTWTRSATGFDEYRAFVTALAPAVHGLSVRPGRTGIALADDHWLVFARRGGEVVGVAAYQITEHGGDLACSTFLARDAPARTLLLQWLARHAGQVATASLPLLPGWRPELWLADLAVTVEAKAGYPDAPPPMARVLAVDGLAGLPTGAAEVPPVTVHVVDEMCGGTFAVGAAGGRLTVAASSAEATVLLTSAGLGALVYGVLDPGELALHGFGEAGPEAAATLRALFPPATPYLHEHF